MTGPQLGRYVIGKRLGAGAWGEVYGAHDPRLDRPVAIKILRTEVGESARVAQARARSLREARALARLSHPNVVAVYDTGEHGGDVFIAMELVTGDTLRTWLEVEPRDWREILDQFVQAGRGLAAAHRAGLVHRDFKPENVLVGGRTRVTDFGLSRPAGAAVAAVDLASEFAGAGGRPWLTRTGSLVGTPRYMAPEQLAGREVDARADQFSFCVALYEALYGRHPFPGDTIEEVLVSIMRGDLRLPPRDSAVPARVRRALARGLAAEPSARFPCMKDLLFELTGGLNVGWAKVSAIVGYTAGFSSLLLTLASELTRGDIVPSLSLGIAAIAVGGSVVPIAAAGSASARGRMQVPGVPRLRVLAWTCNTLALVGGLILGTFAFKWSPPPFLIIAVGTTGFVGAMTMSTEALLAAGQARTKSRSPEPWGQESGIRTGAGRARSHGSSA